MRTVEPGNAPALIRALGADPLVVTIAGEVQPVNRYGTITLRRARGSRDPIGSPATCSLDIGVDAAPTWEKGDPISVKLSEAALTALYGSANVVTTNLVTNPSFETNLGDWFATGSGTTCTSETTHVYEGGVSLRVLTGTATACGARSADMACTPGTRYGARAYVQPTTGMDVQILIQWLNAAADTEISTTAVSYPAADLTVNSWNAVAVDGPAPAGAAWFRVYVRRTGSTTSGQVLYVDTVLARSLAVGEDFDPYEYFDGSTYTDGLDGYTYAWTGAANNSRSTRTFSPATLKAQARYRFTGRISDLKLTTTRGTARASIIATGFLAALGGVDVGDVPWPAESVRGRVLRVLAAAHAADAGISYQVPGTYDGPQVPAKDVDRSAAQQLLEDLSTTTSPKAGLWERRDGNLYWADGYSTGLFPALDLDGGVVKQPLTHEQAPRVNQVTVTPSGKPRVGQLLYQNLCTNPSLEVNTTGWSSSGGATLSRDTAQFLAPGVASLKCVSTGTAAMGASIVATSGYPGQVLHVNAAVRRQGTSGDVRVIVQWQTSTGTILATSAAQTVTVTANVWTRTPMLHFGPAPEGTTQARVYFQLPTAVVGQILNLDRVGIFDDYAGVPPGGLDYFDGSTTASAAYTFGWESTAHASRSYAYATAETPQPTYTWTDLDSVALYGVRAETVASLVDVGAVGFTWVDLITRAKDQLLAGGWAPPDLEVDLLAMLDGRVAYSLTHDTPVKAAAAALRAELGSGRQYYASGDEPAFVPDLSTFGIVTALNETISAHRWTIATSAERTF
jgi:hypothetical protein